MGTCSFYLKERKMKVFIEYITEDKCSEIKFLQNVLYVMKKRKTLHIYVGIDNHIKDYCFDDDIILNLTIDN